MADRKAVNKYYPPEWTPSKGSINKFRGSHPLRERARKLSQGILIIRFEMPYNIWCGGCNNHIGMGVRYNAEKKKVGNYYTTPIYQFRMKCHLCDNHFEIKTDPQNLDYVVVSGARRQEGRWDPTENEQVAPDEREVTRKLAQDSMFKLEHGVSDQQKSSSAAPALALLEDRQERRWKDDYAANQLLRKEFRDKKKKLAENKAFAQRMALTGVEMVDEHPEDIRYAGLLKYVPRESMEEAQKRVRDEIDNRPLFIDTSSKSVVPIQTTTAKQRIIAKVGVAAKKLSTVPSFSNKQNAESPESSSFLPRIGLVKTNKSKNPPEASATVTSSLVSYDTSDDSD